MDQPHTTLVTGANRSIGFSILQLLATRAPSARYILATRSLENGGKALQELRDIKVPTENIHLLALDVSDESSIRAAAIETRKKYGRLDVLVNNAAIAIPEPNDSASIASSYAETFNTNVTGVALMMTHFLPVMKTASPNPRVINVSSAQGSLQRSSTGGLPPTQVVAYCVSKTALNMLTVEFAKKDRAVRFYTACPGHCRTAFNGFRGAKDPLEGARIVAELALAEVGRYEDGFWEIAEGANDCSKVPW